MHIGLSPLSGRHYPYPATTRMYAAAVPAAANPASPLHAAPLLTTKQGRHEQGKNYDAILADLRSRYDEPDAMRRFDDIMRADGFERVEHFGHNPLGPRFATSVNGIFNTLAGAPIGDTGLGQIFNDLGIGTNYDPFATLQTQSIIHGEMVNGSVEYRGETWATYTATVDRKEIFAAWKNAGLDALRDSAGVDVDALVGHIGAWRAEAVDTGLAGLVSGWLAGAGIELDADAGDHVEIRFTRDENGRAAITADFSNPTDSGMASRFSDYVNSRLTPAAAAAFEAVAGSVPPADAGEFVTQYQDGDRSLTAATFRSFIYSARDPSAVIMGSSLGIYNHGYTYQKLVSEDFDPDADLLMGMAYVDENYHAVVGALGEKIRDAVADGTTVASTIGKDEYMARYGATYLPERERHAILPVPEDPDALRRSREAHYAALARSDAVTARIREAAEAAEPYDPRAALRARVGQLYAARQTLHSIVSQFF